MTRPVALAITILAIVFLARPAVAETKPASELTNAIQENTKADNDLKHAYQELILAYKAGAAVTVDLGKVNESLANPKLTKAVRAQLKDQANKLEADVKKRRAALTKLETTFKTQQKAVLHELDRSCVPVLKRLTTQLDDSTLKAVDGLFELFVVADQKELPGLTINASFVDQEVWKEAAKFIGRHGIEYLSGIKKILGSKNPSARLAAAVGLGEIGKPVYTKDPNVHLELIQMKSAIAKSDLDKNEKRVREKLLETAIDAIHSGK